jgi:hypothetical protein
LAADNKQDQKYRLSLAGEFLVAGELLRRNLNAAVTYGNAKRADVVAVSEHSACTIEVKTTQKEEWVVGGKAPEDNDSIWVLVFLPSEDKSPEFFVLKSHDLHVILKPKEDDWRRKCQAKHGRPMPGVFVVRRKEIESHKDAWQKVKTSLKQSS